MKFVLLRALESIWDWNFKSCIVKRDYFLPNCLDAKIPRVNNSFKKSTSWKVWVPRQNQGSMEIRFDQSVICNQFLCFAASKFQFKDSSTTSVQLAATCPWFWFWFFLNFKREYFSSNQTLCTVPLPLPDLRLTMLKTIHNQGTFT